MKTLRIRVLDKSFRSCAIHTTSSLPKELRIKSMDFREPISPDVWKTARTIDGFIPRPDWPFHAKDRLVPDFDHFDSAPKESRDHRINELVHFISQKKFNKAFARLQSLYDQDKSVLNKLGNHECSSLIRIAPQSLQLAPESWIKLKAFMEMIAYHSSHQLLAGDYACLINIAFRARDFPAVQTLWQEVEVRGIAKTTDLWNNYITATCNAYPPMWTHLRLKRQRKFVKLLPVPVASEDAVYLLGRMMQEGVTPNARTYERLLLYMAQQSFIDAVRMTVKSIWGVSASGATESNPLTLNQTPLPIGFSIPSDMEPGSTLYPTWATLQNIFIAFAVNDEVVEGLTIVMTMAKAYGISLAGKHSSALWDTLLLWTFHNSSKGKAPRQMFSSLFEAYSTVFESSPSILALSLQIEHLLSRNRRAKAAEYFIGKLAPRKRKLAAQKLKKLAKTLLDRGYEERALSILDRWAPIHEEYARVKQVMVEYRHRRPWVQDTVEYREGVMEARRIKYAKKVLDLNEKGPEEPDELGEWDEYKDIDTNEQ